ncbi:glycosyl transferase family 2 [Paenibacillus curdlanolyticus YK9]|uniref:Glycosyl transferase family 2 n=1 Tax=Paenibacillus curdlanolyticus YK9 TaxID=717606 RepID=E0IEQ3_9BACL|nr:glycosyltransferase [Paenibacillus curdlanolyticus]EFM09141.1 glycosyl transferase family 2 [Paenibacillus curdlanolyticus YK9]
MKADEQVVICVLGMHRSGTSAITRAINIAGAYVGESNELVQPLVDNPKGFWEYQEFVDINDRVLNQLDSAWDTVDVFPDKWWTREEIVSIKEEIKSIISDKFMDNRLWVFKDPRTCILLPLWKEVFSELQMKAKFVLSIRNPLDVYASLHKRDGYSESKSIGLWAHYTASAIHWTASDERLFVQYDAFLDHPVPYMQRLCRFIGSEMEYERMEAEVKEFLNPSLRHSNSESTAFTSNLQYPFIYRELYRVCLAMAAESDVISAELQAEVDQIYSDLKQLHETWARSRRHAKLQVFYKTSPEQPFGEEHSKIAHIEADGRYITYSFQLPPRVYAPLRIDVSDTPGAVIIRSIRLTDLDSGRLIGEWSADQSYDHVTASENMLTLGKNQGYVGLSLNHDPSLLIERFEMSHSPSKLEITMVHYRLMDALVEEIQGRYSNAQIAQEKLEAALKANREENQAISMQLDEYRLAEQTSRANIDQYKDQVSQLQEKISQLEHQGSMLESRSSELANQNKRLNESYGQAQAEVQQHRIEQARYQAELNHIYGSGGWRALLKYYKVRDRSFPVGSTRRKAIQLTKRALKLAKTVARNLKSYGVSTTIQKAKGKLVRNVGSSNVHVPVLTLDKALNAGAVYDFSKSSNLTVSIVIPTLNAGQDFELLLAMLNRQQGFKTIEIVVVDSGSSDDTVDLAEEYGAKVVKISPEQFSHSYARNLGAEHASAEHYLLIMTQDAMPTSDHWLYELYAAAEANDLVAVSCAESSREDVDLFYRIICWAHYNFLGVEDCDRIMSMPKVRNYENLRCNAQLSDVACLLRKDIFMQYKYRFDYAEDLDLGLRLIADGYRIGLLGQTKVIHSHKRPPYYHLKRGFVDNLFMHQMFDDYSVPNLKPAAMKRDIVYTFTVISNIIEEISRNPDHYSGIDDLKNLIHRMLDEAIVVPYAVLAHLPVSEYADEKTQLFVAKLLDEYKQMEIYPQYNGDGILLHALKGFSTTIFDYLKRSYEVIDRHTLEDFKSALMKAFAIQAGAHLSLCYVSDEQHKSILAEIHGELTKGV